MHYMIHTIHCNQKLYVNLKYSVLFSDSLYDLTAIIPIEKNIYILNPNNLCNGFINKLLDTNLHHIVSQYIYIKYLFIYLSTFPLLPPKKPNSTPQNCIIYLTLMVEVNFLKIKWIMGVEMT